MRAKHLGVVAALTAAAIGVLPSATVAGPSPTGEFTSLTPARILDTRTGNGQDGAIEPVGEHQTISVQVTGRGGVASAGVSAVVMNVTVTQPTQASYLTVWPKGVPRPLVSNLNFVPGQTVPNLVTVAVGSGGQVNAYNRYGSTHVIFDVVGFYSGDAGPAGSRFHSIDYPYRYFDTRSGRGGVGTAPLGPDDTLEFNVLGKGGVPTTGVTGVVMNVTVTQPTAPSYLTVYPNDVGSPPLASNLNYVAGLTVPNLVTVRVPASGIVNFYNRYGTVHVLADVVGYYDDDRSTEAGRFIGLNPGRVFDTREGVIGGPLCEDCWLWQSMSGYMGVPEFGVSALVLNLTATQPTAVGFVTVFPDDLCEIPLASNLNFVPGQTVPNHVIVRLAEPVDCAHLDYPMAFRAYNRYGTVHLIADVFGYFTDDTAYDDWVTLTDDTGAITVDVPADWDETWTEPIGEPPEPSLAAATNLDVVLDDWGAAGVLIRALREAAKQYASPADYMATWGVWDDCAPVETGSYDDGHYTGVYRTQDHCGAGNAGWVAYVLQAPGEDYFVQVVFNTIAPIDQAAMERVLASLDVTWP
ncbi:MAG: hypothetical protein QNJ12_08205 [Ilumatobacter sp.]|uniref:hypothetical protein n=1 Tax=Ilumatobacter sp. TaxID=1967498 RepID=UPI002619E226|nr:hypothetical protein [Ilumatobacter sp.]MDJ0768762.1 hypothetical protein [Ilumatobacter sp.]